MSERTEYEHQAYGYCLKHRALHAITEDCKDKKPEQCECAQLDWSEVIAEARRRGEPTPEHHPDCKRQYSIGVDVAEGEDRGFVSIQNQNLRDEILSNFEEAISKGYVYWMHGSHMLGDPRPNTPPVLPVPSALAEVARQIVTPHQIPPRTVEELIAFAESLFPVGQSGDSAFSITGEPFKKFGLGFFVADNATVAEYMKLRDQLFVSVINTFEDFKARSSCNAVLYWRKKPHYTEEREIDRQGYTCKLIFRMLISDKPPLEKPLLDS